MVTNEFGTVGRTEEEEKGGGSILKTISKRMGFFTGDLKEVNKSPQKIFVEKTFFPIVFKIVAAT